MPALAEEIVVGIDASSSVLTRHIDTVVGVGLAVDSFETLQTVALVTTLYVHARRMVLTTIVQAPVHF